MWLELLASPRISQRTATLVVQHLLAPSDDGYFARMDGHSFDRAPARHLAHLEAFAYATQLLARRRDLEMELTLLLATELGMRELAPRRAFDLGVARARHCRPRSDRRELFHDWLELNRGRNRDAWQRVHTGCEPSLSATDPYGVYVTINAGLGARRRGERLPATQSVHDAMATLLADSDVGVHLRRCMSYYALAMNVLTYDEIVAAFDDHEFAMHHTDDDVPWFEDFDRPTLSSYIEQACHLY